VKQSFFLWGECLGSRELPPLWQTGPNTTAFPAKLPYQNLALCCPVCGEVWGRIWYDDAKPDWLFESRNCPKHPDVTLKPLGWLEIGRGSFLCKFPEIVSPLSYADDLPERLLRHEFNMLMEKYL